MRLLYKHCKALRYCDRGIKAFMEAKGIDYADFVANGVPAEVARSWNDLMVNRALELAERESNG